LSHECSPGPNVDQFPWTTRGPDSGGIAAGGGMWGRPRNGLLVVLWTAVDLWSTAVCAWVRDAVRRSEPLG
jgi:hypothetical protein